MPEVGTRRIWRRAGLGLLAMAALVLASEQPSRAGQQLEPSLRPQRIVSINLCTDQLLVGLVERSRIAAVSRLAADPALSAVADRIEGLKRVSGSGEEVLALAPDLVVTNEFSTPHVVALLRRVGVPVVVVPIADTFDGIRNAIRVLATSVGEAARGEAMIADFDRRLATASPLSPFRPTALAYQVNSLTSESGGLIDAAMSAAGFVNAAALRTLGPGGRLPLETFLAHPPDLVVLANDPEAFRTVTADNLRHRAFRDLLARRRHVHIPMPLWLCGTPAIATAVEELGRERARLIEARAGAESVTPAGVAADIGIAR